MKKLMLFSLKIISLSILNFIFIFAASNCYADDCSMGRTPDGVYPINDSDVVMLSEDIMVDVENRLVECSFNFKNTGTGKYILIGFPKKTSIDSDNTSTDKHEISDFKAFSDNVELPVSIDTGIQNLSIYTPSYPNYSEWYIFNVYIKENEIKNIKNTYKVEFTSNSQGDIYAGYIIKTGAYWKDKIGHAKIYFNMGTIKPYNILNLYPNNFRFDGNNLIWEKYDFEPEYDLQVVFNRTIGENSKSLDEQQYKKYIEEKEYFKSLEMKMKNANEANLLEMYNEAVNNNHPIAAQYILSSLPLGSIQSQKPEFGKIDIYKSGENKNVNISAEMQDRNADIVLFNLRCSHYSNDRKVIDFEYPQIMNNYYMSYKNNFSILTDELLPGIKYDLQFKVWDAQGNSTEKTIKYEVVNNNNIGHIFIWIVLISIFLLTFLLAFVFRKRFIIFFI
jgi:hypothetical protein